MICRLLVLIAVLSATAPVAAQDTPASVVAGRVPFAMHVVASGLADPWELSWGPDNYLWVTERTGGKIDRINPKNGAKSTLIALDDVSAPGGQDGLLGMAFHPDFLTGSGTDFVYAAYTYVDMSRPDPVVTDHDNPYRYLYTKIVRLSYDRQSELLGDPVELIKGLPASNDHNSGRMKIGPDGKALFYHW
ncbi:PQQ-dependent sugar dehydrogenase [Devosia algicola]|uniref:PQQ-dependent sugar dehydrogenase n=1 Tax=Devosia algicola TaxID=3026418 RepID=A0ABY7YK91_9HYPH|nr:PQQ-dependent sugar dehydrogenase [Devosia algicola]WDR01607.1 PQQ-dependent sugar dehydrogenase [Devosia algicola]